MTKDNITKTRKKLTKLIRKFNKGQVEYVAVGKHADNTDIVMIIDSWGADSLRHILTIRPGGIYSTDKSTFKINDNLLEFMTNSYELVKKLNDTEIQSANIRGLDANDIPTIENPFGINDSITQQGIQGFKPKVEL
ncbi:hypothetical protein [Limosilactobacillus reuteri]|uniref:hypothetical protein n=1 Tax=Limosilactobacillus reuteri TaxID=1598 RepID=UPI001E3454BD|nr:hypothetical protein [Limosilactobacillus reuteri]MCC4359111.1 hypothetical protein [Limosilactobacillus reuteri]MCC4361748.1 hypothetical protein [Limosilactobacillus reuteri]MCC4365415.1 hypothetical protein [Limosilactobacillus reuteri]